MAKSTKNIYSNKLDFYIESAFITPQAGIEAYSNFLQS